MACALMAEEGAFPPQLQDKTSARTEAAAPICPTPVRDSPRAIPASQERYDPVSFSMNRALDVRDARTVVLKNYRWHIFASRTIQRCRSSGSRLQRSHYFWVGVLSYVLQSGSPAKLVPVNGRLEDRIQQLCAQVKATDDDEELYQLCEELRQALKEHVSQLRQQVAEYRRVGKTHSRKKGR